MTTEEIVAWCSFAVFLLIQTALGGYFAGRMSNRVTVAEEDIKENHSDIDGLGKKVDDNATESFDMFVSKGRCDGVNKQQDLKFTSLLEQRDIYNSQNSKEHEDLLVQGKEIVKCLNLLQSGEKC